MNAQELETAVREKIPIVVLIVNDNAFGFIKWEQKSKGFGSFGLDYANPDFARFAESFGAVGMKVKKGDDLSAILRDAFSRNKPVVIECPVDYSVNYETFSQELGSIVCEA
jgi:acetolactate synthase-1/2/3 large subunit